MAVWREDRHTGSCQPTDGAQLRNFPESRLRWRPCAAVRTEEGAAARDGSVPVSRAARVSTGRNACVSYSGSSRPGPPGRFLRAGRPLSVGTPCSRASPEPRPHCPHPAPFPGATGLRGRKARGAPLCRGGRSAPAMGGGDTACPRGAVGRLLPARDRGSSRGRPSVAGSRLWDPGRRGREGHPRGSVTDSSSVSTQDRVSPRDLCGADLLAWKEGPTSDLPQLFTPRAGPRPPPPE